MKTNKMNKVSLHALKVLALGLAVALSSCAQMNSQLGAIGYDQTETQIINEGRFGGAAIGALAGAVIGNNSKLGKTQGALLGGLLGGVAGDAVGKNQANQARDMRMSNDNLRSMIASAKKNNRALASYNRKVSKRIAELRKLDSGQQVKEVKAEKVAVDKAIKQTDKLIALRNAQKQKLSGSARSQLTRETAELKSNRAELSRHQSTLASLYAKASNEKS